tara:strand:- start:6880 stop:7569 length:690 start_codon:yes stop_codon:yes gene_type:complete
MSNLSDRNNRNTYGSENTDNKDYMSTVRGLLITSSTQFLILIMPYIVIGFFLLLTFFNNNLKGITYFIGILILFIITNAFSFVYNQFSNKNINKNSIICRFFGPERAHLPNGISIGTLVYVYTLCYLIIPMIYYNIFNLSVIITFLLLIGCDFIVSRHYKCSDNVGWIISLSIGIVVGITWAFFVISMNNKLLYHTDYVSDKSVCSMPDKQSFKCELYKDGQLISESTV